MSPKALDYESLNENVKKVQYAVRGELYLRASELQKEGKKVQIFEHFWTLTSLITWDFTSCMCIHLFVFTFYPLFLA